MREIALLHKRALPHTLSARLGVGWLQFLYTVVGRVGYVRSIEKEGRVVGVVSGIGKLILTLVVDPEHQRQGIGRQLIRELKGEQWVYTEQCSVGFYSKMGFREWGRIGKMIWLRREK